MSGKRHETPRSDPPAATGAAPSLEESPGPGANSPISINLISLGCPKNLVDSEMILGNAGLAGFRITPSAEDADVIVINTCGFIDQAREESVNTILEACEVKRQSSTPKKVVVAGCLGQRHGEELKAEIPEVDAIIGLGQYGDIGSTLRALVADHRQAAPLYRLGSADFACNAETGRLRLTPSHYGYVRISEGCDNPCTFCSIPSIRGHFRSKSISMIKDEVRELVDSGSTEIILISQDTTSYGVDIDGSYQLPRLLEAVAGVAGVRWVRLLYVYPSCFSDEMIEAVASIPQVLPYVDIPLQHIAEKMLRRMGRRMGEVRTRALLERMRERIPGLYLRTTFIVGFPGEDEQEFKALKDFVEDFRFERLGVFPYSHEEGTPAYRLKELVDEEVVEARTGELMLIQQEVAFDQNRRRLGESVEVLLDRREGDTWVARSHGEAPDIDPVVLVPAGPFAGDGTQQSSARETTPEQGNGDTIAARRTFVELPLDLSLEGPGGSRTDSGDATTGWEPGRFETVEITGSRDYDLVARPTALRRPVHGRAL